jgi:hypothetical protein
LPPDTYGTLGAEQTQRLYYPEFLPDPNRPAWLPGGDKDGIPPGTNITFGTLRYDKLLEVVLDDCRRFVDSKDDLAKVLPQWAEDWLIARTMAEDTMHFFHAPSLPFAYSSGNSVTGILICLTHSRAGSCSMKPNADGNAAGLRSING